MPHLNNICIFELIMYRVNGNVNMGNAILEGTSANSEGVGGQSIIGDEFASPDHP